MQKEMPEKFPWFLLKIKEISLAFLLFAVLCKLYNVSWALNHHIIMISEESCDSCVAAENSALSWQEKLNMKIYSNRKQLF